MNWRPWLFGILTSDTSLVAMIPAPVVFAGGSLVESPGGSYVIYRLQSEDRQLSGSDAPVVSRRFAEVWVYDVPGQYDDIDAYLATLRNVLDAQVMPTGGIACRWLGDSNELFDEELKSSVRYGTYELLGKVA